jgi:hypothetical protein
MRHLAMHFAVVLENNFAGSVKAQGIGTQVYHQRSLRQQECFADLGYGIQSIKGKE